MTLPEDFKIVDVESFGGPVTLDPHTNKINFNISEMDRETLYRVLWDKEAYWYFYRDDRDDIKAMQWQPPLKDKITSAWFRFCDLFNIP
jgi:hypothetical protein